MLKSSCFRIFLNYTELMKQSETDPLLLPWYQLNCNVLKWRRLTCFLWIKLWSLFILPSYLLDFLEYKTFQLLGNFNFLLFFQKKKNP